MLRCCFSIVVSEVFFLFLRRRRQVREAGGDHASIYQLIAAENNRPRWGVPYSCHFSRDVCLAPRLSTCSGCPRHSFHRHAHATIFFFWKALPLRPCLNEGQKHCFWKNKNLFSSVRSVRKTDFPKVTRNPKDLSLSVFLYCVCS